MQQEPERRGLLAQGRVQGVGFRPFVWRLASALGLSGYVANSPAGLILEAQGSQRALAEFARRLVAEAPPAARLENLAWRKLPLQPAESGFRIAASSAEGPARTLPAADIGVCDACLADLRRQGGRRQAHAFASCCHCGPRFSIMRALPYDRGSTSMACFALCPHCAREYASPADRRFHAQPLACPRCGPRLRYVSRPDLPNPFSSPQEDGEALDQAARLLLEGGILALRGLGGFQLAADARNSQALATLRRRKQRPAKALAVMLPDLAAAARLCRLSADHASLLQSAARPIVCCPPAPEADLSPLIAPDAPCLGIMLPATPLHTALLDRLAAAGMANPALVLSSGNRPGEPICLGNRQALRDLAPLADGWLLHNRDIVARVDDSVLAVAESGPIFLRRARGYVPEPVPLPAPGPAIFAAGAQLKAVFCLARDSQAFMSQHIGDLDSVACQKFYAQALRHLEDLLAIRPGLVACDAHPDYASTRIARAYAAQRGLELITVQHHLAHAAACLGENGCQEEALALCLDGSGLGADGSIWGGELLRLNIRRASWHRRGGIAPFALAGGEQAIREPWRVAAALLAEKADLLPPHILARPGCQAVLAMLERNFNCPRSSSCGRLFDAAAALLDLCQAAEYEAKAPLLLEKAALAADEAPLWELMPLRQGGIWRLDGATLLARAALALRQGRRASEIALSFHRSLARGLALLAAAEADGQMPVAICGGVAQNALFVALLRSELQGLGLVPLTQKLLPPGDGGLAYGQAVWARARWLNGGIKTEWP